MEGMILVSEDRLKQIVSESVQKALKYRKAEKEKLETYTYADLAAIFNCTLRHAHSYRSKIPFIKDGKTVRFLRSDVEQYIADNKVQVSNLTINSNNNNYGKNKKSRSRAIRKQSQQR